MGYNVSQVATQLRIPLAGQRAAREAIAAEAKREKFRWVETSDILKRRSLVQVLDECRWASEIDEKGCIDHLTFLAEKLGDEERLFQVIAPWVEAGSFIEMLGEEGDHWRWTFDGEKMTMFQGVGTWPI